MMKKIFFVYPRITKYILPVIVGLSEHCEVDFIYSPAPAEDGFGEHELPQSKNIRWKSVKTIKPFGINMGVYQSGLLSNMIFNRPDAIIIFANPRYLSYWLVLSLGFILQIPVFSRGQGLYKKENAGQLHKLMFATMINFSKKYMCYTDSVKETLLPLVNNPAKLVVDYNTIYNDFGVSPQEKTGQEKGILFVGRLRERCGIEELIAAFKTLKEKNLIDLNLHIVGDGILGQWVREQARENPWIIYHGMNYSDQEIQKISLECRFGVFPGSAGLSVVHLMSLSLPPLIHDSNDHNGPEPSYVKPGINGWFFSLTSESKSMSVALLEMARLSPLEMQTLQKNAFQTFRDLSTPPFHERIWTLLNLE